jgi:hypothetical protein
MSVGHLTDDDGVRLGGKRASIQFAHNMKRIDGRAPDQPADGGAQPENSADETVLKEPILRF